MAYNLCFITKLIKVIFPSSNHIFVPPAPHLATKFEMFQVLHMYNNIVPNKVLCSFSLLQEGWDNMHRATINNVYASFQHCKNRFPLLHVDTQHERNELMAKVYPKLKTHCKQYGYEFQVQKVYIILGHGIGIDDCTVTADYQ